MSFHKPLIHDNDLHLVLADGDKLVPATIPLASGDDNIITIEPDGLKVKAADTLSAQAGNATTLGADGKLFTPAPEPVRPADLISDDPDNYLTLGADAKLYTPTPHAADFLSNEAENSLGLSPIDQKIYFKKDRPYQWISSDSGNVLRLGVDANLYVAAGDLCQQLVFDVPKVVINDDDCIGVVPIQILLLPTDVTTLTFQSAQGAKYLKNDDDDDYEDAIYPAELPDNTRLVLYNINIVVGTHGVTPDTLIASLIPGGTVDVSAYGGQSIGVGLVTAGDELNGTRWCKEEGFFLLEWVVRITRTGESGAMFLFRYDGTVEYPN